MFLHLLQIRNNKSPHKNPQTTNGTSKENWSSAVNNSANKELLPWCFFPLSSRRSSALVTAGQPLVSHTLRRQILYVSASLGPKTCWLIWLDQMAETPAWLCLPSVQSLCFQRKPCQRFSPQKNWTTKSLYLKCKHLKYVTCQAGISWTGIFQNDRKDTKLSDHEIPRHKTPVWFSTPLFCKTYLFLTLESFLETKPLISGLLQFYIDTKSPVHIILNKSGLLYIFTL